MWGSINLEQLGTAAVVVIILLWWNRTLRERNERLETELQDERKYARERDSMTSDTMKNLSMGIQGVQQGLTHLETSINELRKP